MITFVLLQRVQLADITNTKKCLINTWMMFDTVTLTGLNLFIYSLWFKHCRNTSAMLVQKVCCLLCSGYLSCGIIWIKHTWSRSDESTTLLKRNHLFIVCLIQEKHTQVRTVSVPCGHLLSSFETFSKSLLISRRNCVVVWKQDCRKNLEIMYTVKTTLKRCLLTRSMLRTFEKSPHFWQKAMV